MARAPKRAQRQSSKSAQSVVRTRPKSKTKSRKRSSPAKLADKLRQLRESLGLSQGDIAAKLDVKDRASISGYERGEREPPLPTLLAYARLGKIKVEVLIDDELDLP
jgi:DNA-binding XRE family transcriptional regulator